MTADMGGRVKHQKMLPQPDELDRRGSYRTSGFFPATVPQPEHVLPSTRSGIPAQSGQNLVSLLRVHPGQVTPWGILYRSPWQAGHVARLALDIRPPSFW